MGFTHLYSIATKQKEVKEYEVDCLYAKTPEEIREDMADFQV